MSYYYVYCLWRRDATARYIGSRKSATPPHEDFGVTYFSSGCLETAFRANPEAFDWTILSTHATHEDALNEETYQIGLLWGDPTCVNGFQFPNRFRYDETWRQKTAEKNRKQAQDPEWQRKQAEAGRKRSQNPEWRRKHAEVGRKNAQDPEWRRKNAEAIRKRSQDPEWRRKHAEANRKKAQDPEYREKLRQSARQREARKRAARAGPALF